MLLIALKKINVYKVCINYYLTLSNPSEIKKTNLHLLVASLKVIRRKLFRQRQVYGKLSHGFESDSDGVKFSKEQLNM